MLLLKHVVGFLLYHIIQQERNDCIHWRSSTEDLIRHPLVNSCQVDHIAEYPLLYWIIVYLAQYQLNQSRVRLVPDFFLFFSNWVRILIVYNSNTRIRRANSATQSYGYATYYTSNGTSKDLTMISCGQATIPFNRSMDIFRWRYVLMVVISLQSVLYFAKCGQVLAQNIYFSQRYLQLAKETLCL